MHIHHSFRMNDAIKNSCSDVICALSRVQNSSVQLFIPVMTPCGECSDPNLCGEVYSGAPRPPVGLKRQGVSRAMIICHMLRGHGNGNSGRRCLRVVRVALPHPSTGQGEKEASQGSNVSEMRNSMQDKEKASTWTPPALVTATAKE